jgi:DNA polymerase elongation subunit (family B)
MLTQIKFERILFLDIETIPQYASLNEAPDNYKKLWEKKASYIKKEHEQAGEIYHRAGIYAEFGRIICISTGMIIFREHNSVFKIFSFAGDDEKKILLDFRAFINKISEGREIYLCAHNGKEFDFPYIARRMLINGVPLPNLLDVAGKKPWEISHLDTMELWKFGDHKHYTSLELLAEIFGIASPKTDIDGTMIAEVYWQDKALKRIVEYCQRDVVAIAQIMRRYKGEPLIPENAIEVIEDIEKIGLMTNLG